MSKNSSNPRADAAKMASLSIVWGAMAGVAYLGLISGAVSFIKASTGWKLPDCSNSPAAACDAGLRTLNAVQSSGQSPSSLYQIAVAAIPIAIAAVIILSIIARVRPTMTPLGGALIAASIVGLIGTGLLFLNVIIENNSVRSGVAVAVVSIVLVSVLLRLQKFMRNSYSSNPALASFIVGVVIVFYLFLANETTISSVILQNVDVWLAFASFALTFYAGAILTRRAQRANKTR